MITFRGEDQETKADIGFYTIMQKIQASDNRKKWKYQLKNLIILDYIVENNIYLEKIGELEVDMVKDLEIKSEIKDFNLEELVKCFLEYI